MDLTPDERKALEHIQRNGDDRNLGHKKWKPVKLALHRKGLLVRRIGDWAWVPHPRGLGQSPLE
jgi:hypothetical protein